MFFNKNKEQLKAHLRARMNTLHFRTHGFKIKNDVGSEHRREAYVTNINGNNYFDEYNSCLDDKIVNMAIIISEQVTLHLINELVDCLYTNDDFEKDVGLK